MRTHGSHIECVVKDVEKFISENLPNIVGQSSLISTEEIYGFNIATEKKQQNTISTLMYLPENSHIGFLTIIMNKQLWTCYPIATNTIQTKMTVDNIIDWENLAEGQIVASIAELDGFSICFFEPMYHCNRLFRKIYDIGDVVNFQLAGFAYFLKQQEFDTIKINDEINVSTDNMCVFLGLNNAGDDDYSLLAKIKECEIYEFLSTKFYQLKVNIYQDITTELEIFLLLPFTTPPPPLT